MTTVVDSKTRIPTVKDTRFVTGAGRRHPKRWFLCLDQRKQTGKHLLQHQVQGTHRLRWHQLKSPPVITDKLRLVDGTCNSEGRVEIFYDGVWGTICDDFWDDTDAGVVCRSLGYSSGTAVGSAEFGQGSGDIIFDNVECSAGDTALEYCRSNAPFDNNCSHAEDAGVRCTE
eukprot:XP_011660819.1 PREDICTED: galectin-3-binding protein-like [Strongylocentrotus purpuratus]